jgi:endogenous inhibitor of DNA gyrase (YacG/DUF329 family)
MSEKEKCPHCGSTERLFMCSFMAVNCADCGQYVCRTPEEIEKRLSFLREKKGEKG